ncbi:MFS transporter [Micavibrio aeruginosavorus]|uniref:MFS transporter n=1 Tax=Micavibrio aeruginosavorus TaxID=349221 RepID=UPI003F4A9FB1
MTGSSGMAAAVVPSPSLPLDRTARRSIAAWCLYDWANSAFATVIITFIFSVFFARNIVGDEVAGTAQWGMAIGISGLIIAVLSPVLGAVADHFGARKPWVGIFSALCIICTALMYFGEPNGSPGNIAFVLTLLVMANVTYEIALVFNNAMLPHIAPHRLIGRVSGWAWGMGYMGGLICLALSLFGLIGLGDIPPFLPVSEEGGQNLRLVAPLVAVWFGLFTIPMLIWTDDVKRTDISVIESVRRGLRQLKDSAHTVGRQKNMVRFLIGSAIYRDGLNTLFAMGGLYAAATFAMSFTDLLIFAILLNVSSGIGAALFAGMDDDRGSRQTLILSLAGLILAGAAVLLAQDKTLFTFLALALGLFIGPVQSASRTYVARLSPPELVAQSYGLYSFTGRAVAMMGPFVYGLAVATFETQRAGMVSILLFWIVGMAFLFTIHDEEEEPAQ